MRWGASVAEMERRYKLFAENNVREIKAYNKLAAQTGMEHLLYRQSSLTSWPT